MRYIYTLFTLVFLISCSSFVKPPELISIDGFEFLGEENGKFAFSSNLVVLNKNNFKIKAEEIKSQVLFESQVIGDFLIDKEFFIEKKSQKNISAQIYLNPKNINSSLFSDELKSLLIKGYVKTPFLNQKINFQYDYIFNLNGIMDSFVDEQISKSVFRVKEIKLKKIISKVAQIEILLNFYNDLGFDIKIKNFSSMIYKDLGKSKVVARSNNLEIIKVDSQNNIDFPANIDLKLLSISPSMLLGSLRNDLNFYIDFDFIVEVFDNEFPIILSRTIAIDFKNLEISIEWKKNLSNYFFMMKASCLKRF